MRTHVTCPCGTKGKVQLIHGMPVVFYKRPDGVWWRDNVSAADLDGPLLCGYCSVPSQALRWNGLAQTKRGKG